MSDHLRYAVIRESDGRFVVIDKLSENRWVSGPTGAMSARRDADKRNTSWIAARAQKGEREEQE